MAIKSQTVIADFETTTDPLDVRVWAACAVEIKTNKTVFLGNCIDDFFKWLEDKNTICYFHNLRFDGEFILSYLLRNGYTHVERKPDPVTKKKPPNVARTFETVITETGLFYSITVYFTVANKKYKKVVFQDSLKKLPFPVATIAKAFELPMSKLSIDYNAQREVGHELTAEEKEYIEADCKIVSSALSVQMEQDLTKITIGSDALASYKKIIGKNRFEKLFPILPLELDSDLRRAYRGGFTYLNPKYKNTQGLKGLTLDVNSLYPAMMYFKPLPYGYPYFFEGKPDIQAGNPYNIFVVKIRAAFEVKKDHLPTIQLKRNHAFIPTQYITSSRGEITEMILTSVDLQLFLDHYDVSYIEYVCGWKFKSKIGMFKEYIDYWMHIKETTTGALRQLAKLMLNNLYGKFGTNPKKGKKVPYLDENEIVNYHTPDPEITDPVYIPMAAFITAYARETTIRAAQKVYDRFIYADTDSLHLVGYDMPEGLEVHPTHLGAWKHEGNFTNSYFIKPKTYMETMHEIKSDTLKNYVKNMCSCDVVYREPDGIHTYKTHVTCAGMPDNVKEIVTYDTFKQGNTFAGKLLPKRYKGGVILEDSFFTIH